MTATIVKFANKYSFDLGLPIAQRIIDMHHGKIEVQTEVGVGTTFRILFPYQSSSS